MDLFRVTALIFLLFLMTENIDSVLLVSLQSQSGSDSAMKEIAFCIDCPSPADEGSLVSGLKPKHGIQTYSVSGEVVYCIPNLANGETLLNKYEFHNRLVFVDRGVISLQQKVLQLQQADALGVIIADDGHCNKDFTFCGPRIGGKNDGGFAANDDKLLWNDIHIPAVLISVQTAEIFRKFMNIKRVDVPGFGFQNVSVLLPKNDEL